MTDLTSRLKNALAFDEHECRQRMRPAFKDTEIEDMVNGVLQQHARTHDLLLALVKVAGVVKHALDIGYFNEEGSTMGWAEDALAAVVKELEKLEGGT